MRLHHKTNRFHFELLERRRLLSFSLPVDYGVGLAPQDVAAADFNSDGRLDLAVANSGSNTVSMLLGNGDGTVQAHRTSGAGTGPELVLAADLNGDVKIDLVTVNSNYPNGSGDLSVLLGNGDGTFQPPQTVVLPAQFPPGYTGSDPLAQTAIAAAIGDFNADGKLDLVAGGSTQYSVVIGYDDYGYPIYQYYTDGYVNVLLGTGAGTFGPGTGYYAQPSLYGLFLADFNGDGRTDVVTSVGSGSLRMMRGNGDGTLQDAQEAYVGACFIDISMPVGDFNRDGKLDLLMRDATGNFAVLLRGNGDGTFRQGEYVYAGTTINAAVVGDVNADGKLDIVVLHSDIEYGSCDDYQCYDPITTRSARVLLGYGDGSFAPPAVSDLGTLPSANIFTAAVLADLDGDGFPDLAASASNYDYNYQGAVVVAHNNGNGATKTYAGPTNGGNWSTAANWSPSGVPAASDLVTIAGKSVNLSTSATFASLTLTAGASLAVASNGSRVLRTSTLFISADSKLNLNDNDLILDYTGATPMSDVVTKIVQGRGASPTGMYSPRANASGNLHALGVAEASQALGISGTQTKLFDGQAVDATTILVKFTYAGDANLDGKINIDDYGHIDTSVGIGLTGWINGDFNYDGKINIDDYGIIDVNVGMQGPPLGNAPAIAAPPAPASGAVMESWLRRPAREDEAVALDASSLVELLA